MRISLGKTSAGRLGIFLLWVAMYSIGTLSSFTGSWSITLVLLGVSAGFLCFSYFSSGGRHVSSEVICWLIFTVFCLFGVLRGGTITGFLFYVIGLIMLATCESIETDAIYSGFKWLKWGGLLFAAGCYWQYLFPNQYYIRLYPYFTSIYQQAIRRQFYFHKMCTGFTSQTVISAQFIILGLMVVLYTFSLKKTRKEKMVSIIEIIFLLGGLLLTGKRSPILNLAAAILVVDMITVKRSKRGNRIIWIALGVIVALTILYFVAPLFGDSKNSIVRLMEFSSTEDIEDASNGRFSLISFAISEFKQHPITGIGWGRYRQIYDTTGAHNIYLQLLCECGIFGFVLSVGGMFFVLFRSIRILKLANNGGNTVEAAIMKCSVFIQVYIVVYGLFGNPLYDPNYMLMYLIGFFISASMTFRYKYIAKI